MLSRLAWPTPFVSAIDGERNILISGGTGTGKTTLLNALAAHIPARDRVVVIEETAEIHLDKPNVVRLEARRAQAPLGQEAPLPPVSIADLLRAALRHRPDRILVGEVRGAEAFDLLQALNTGHLGSLSTIHANSAEQAFTRLAHCVLTANVGLPHHSVREAIALAIHVIVHISRIDGVRRVTQIVDVRGYDARDRSVRARIRCRARMLGGRSRAMRRSTHHVAVVLFLVALTGCGQESTPDFSVYSSVVPGRCLDRHAHD